MRKALDTFIDKQTITLEKTTLTDDRETNASESLAETLGMRLTKNQKTALEKFLDTYSACALRRGGTRRGNGNQ